MKVTATEKNRRLFFRVAGEIDHHAAKGLAEEIERGIETVMPRDCVLDLAEVQFMDSSGIAVILKAYRRMNELDGRLWVENVQPQPMRVLDASGIERIIGITAGA